MSISKYHVSKNLSPVSSFDKQSGQYYTLTFSTPLTAGTYTIGAEITPDTGVSSARISFRKSDSSQDIATNITIQEGRSEITVTLTSDCYYIYFYGSTTVQDIVPIKYDSLMLNSGSTALPYEPYGDSFKDWFYRKYGTETETFTTLPKTIIGDGQNISAYTIKGNMSQSGTPTPSNPVYPTECGDKTANLLNPNGTWSPPSGQTAEVTVSGNSITITGKYYAYTSVPVTANENYTAKYSATGDRVYVVAYRAQPFTTANMITSLATTGTTINVGNTDTVWLLFYSGDGTTGTTTYSNFMFNEGSTPLDFEPYGYKIPILSNGTTYPIYLSEPIRKIGDSVDSLISTGTVTYSIKKIVLTGDETCYPYSYQSTNGIEMINMLDVNYQRTNGICSHYPVATTGSANSLWIGVNNKTLYFVGILDNLGLSSSTAFKQWLATQYANGTPVTVWYVLATAETETFTAPTLPTSGTAQTFDVDTTLKPSEVSLTYHGWHEHSDEKYVGGVVNKFNYLTMADGVIGSYLNSNGAVIESSNWSITDYIPCDGTTFTLYPIGGNAPAMCLYNSNKQLLVAKSYNSGGSETTIPVTITSSSTASYARFSYYSGGGGADLTQIMFVEGSTVPSEYHPYYEWVEE